MAKIVQFNPEARREIREAVVKTRTNDLARRRNPPRTAGYQVWYFELLEPLVGDANGEGSPRPALAVRRKKWQADPYDPTIGRWVVERDEYGAHNPGDEFYVYDGGGIGFCGSAGAWGTAEINPAQAAPKYQGKRRLPVVNLVCPDGSGPECDGGSES